MLIGTTILKMGAATLNSPSFPRGGLSAALTVLAQGIIESPTLVITVEHRNEDETSWATAGTFANITAVGSSNLSVTTLKEIIRLTYSFSAGSDGDGFHIVVNTPAWRPY